MCQPDYDPVLSRGDDFALTIVLVFLALIFLFGVGAGLALGRVLWA